MSYSVTFIPANSLTPDVLAFWREPHARQDVWRGLTGSPEWYILMAERSVKPAVVGVARAEGGQIVALLPLLFQLMPFGRREVLVARVCGGDVVGGVGVRGECSVGGDRCGDGRILQYGMVWDAILAYSPDVAAIVLDHVDEARLPAIQVSCGRGRGVFLHACSKLMPHYRVVLPSTYGEFRKLRSASSLRKMEARERAMVREAGGECRLVEICEPDDWAPYAAEINRLMNTAWQAVRLGHGFDIEGCRVAAERGWLRSFLLLVGNKPASFVLGYQETAPVGTVFHYEQIGHDAEISRYSSPGTSLLYRLVERLYERNTPLCLDFGEGEAEYKKALANDIAQVQSVMLVRNVLKWKMRFGLMEIAQKVKELVAATTERLGIKARIVKYLKTRATIKAKAQLPPS